MLKQEYMNAINCGMEVIRYLERSEEYSMLSYSHNSIGLCMKCRGNVENAIVYFLLAAEYAQFVQNEETEGIAYNNIAGIFKEIDLYEKAIEYYEKAEHCFEGIQTYALGVSFNMMYC